MTLEQQQQQTITIEKSPSSNSDSPTKTLFTQRNRCCFNFPCFGPGTTPHLTLGGGPSSSTNTDSFWDRIRVGESDNKWWAKPIKAFKKVREWSEIVAGPKWKTFIRRFNRNNRHRHGHGHGQVKFQYDPLSYALNFDEGPGQGQNGHFEEECFVDFSSRYAASARSSMDLGKGAPAS